MTVFFFTVELAWDFVSYMNSTKFCFFFHQDFWHFINASVQNHSYLHMVLSTLQNSVSHFLVFHASEQTLFRTRLLRFVQTRLSVAFRNPRQAPRLRTARTPYHQSYRRRRRRRGGGRGPHATPSRSPEELNTRGSSEMCRFLVDCAGGWDALPSYRFRMSRVLTSLQQWCVPLTTVVS